MNELDKSSLCEENVESTGCLSAANPVSGETESVAIEKEEVKPVCDVCAETESPSMSIADAADAAIASEKKSEEECACASSESDVCSETESPAMSIAQAADEAEESVRRSFHTMTKQQLVEALKEIVDAGRYSAHREVNSLRKAFSDLKERQTEKELSDFVDEGNAPENFSSTPDATDIEFQTLFTQFREGRAKYVAAEEEKRAANLQKKREIVAKLTEISEDIDNINMRFAEFKQLQADFKAIKEIPQSEETEIWKQFQTSVEQFYDRLKMNKELRDLDFKKNLELKRQLIDEVKKLETKEDVVEALRNLQSLREQWREIGPVAKDLRDEIWKEFNDSATIVFRRHQDFFESRKAEEQKAEEEKTEICDKAEEIVAREFKTGTDWEQAANEIKELQEKWRTIGFASRKVNNALYARFRKACDDFFTARGEHYRNQRESFEAAIKGKETLIGRVEALAEEPDLKKAIAETLKIQDEWKNVGMVPHKYKDALWKRFRAACDVIFERRKQENSEQHAEQTANLEAKRSVIARLKEIDMEMERGEGIAKVRELQKEWNSIGFVPYRQKNAIQEEYRRIVDSLYDNFKMKENKARMNNFRNQIDSMGSDDNKLNRERERLLRDLDRKRQELNTYRNNLGFFNVKSSAGNSMLKEMERRTRQIEEEIQMLRSKIDMVDGKIK